MATTIDEAIDALSRSSVSIGDALVDIVHARDVLIGAEVSNLSMGFPVDPRLEDAIKAARALDEAMQAIAKATDSTVMKLVRLSNG